jgi:ribosomal-protein-alanine N-acetyltransferase
MVAQIDLSIRTAREEDRQKLANLIHFEALVHRHLDWRPPLDWIGYRPYLVAEQEREFIAALACPPDPPDVAWIRLFAAASNVNAGHAWSTLWSMAKSQLSEHPGMTVAAIPLQKWFEKLLQASRFRNTTEVIMLLWQGTQLPPSNMTHQVTIRPMNIDDLDEVEKLDEAAFGLLWRNSRESLELAYRQAAVATVVDDEDFITGYQISTATNLGGHLARLAVHPDYQGLGIGYALLRDVLEQFERRGANQISVNTQSNNIASLALYKKAGFHLTGETYPVYQYYFD